MTIAQANPGMLAAVSPVALLLVAALACAIWVVLYLLPGWRRGASESEDASPTPLPEGLKWLLPPLRIAVGAGVLCLVAAAAEQIIVLATDWPIWLIALLGAVCVEAIMLLYALERRTVSRRAGAAVCATRIALVLGVIMMLAQPTWSARLDEQYERSVAILLDDSASMHFPEVQMDPAEKVRLAETFSLTRRPVHLDVLDVELGMLTDELDGWRKFLAEMSDLSGEERGRLMAARRNSMRKSASNWQDKLAVHAKELVSEELTALHLPAAVTSEMSEIRTKLLKQVSENLAKIAKAADQSAPVRLAESYGKINTAISNATVALAGIARDLRPLARTADKAFYASLDDNTRKRLDALSGKTRFQLARDVLLYKGKSGKDPSLLERLKAKFNVSLYRFAAEPTELDVEEFAKSAPKSATQPATRPAVAPSNLPEELQQTDLAAALAKMLGRADNSELIGVILLSDVRHTARGYPDSYARDLGKAESPIFPIVVGSDSPPPDAAIAGITAPEAISPGDELFVDANCKLDGLAGKNVHVVLTDGDRVVDEKTVTVGELTVLRKRIQFSDKPATGGLHVYRLEIEPISGEINMGNNDYSFSVNVTDSDTKLLIIEDRPRWEYRYVKNLFVGRDEQVRLQHVLLRPDRITGEPNRPTIHASATRTREESEATALPKDKDEWLKFDVIVIGDIPPSVLDGETLDILKEAVEDRGKTLIFIAGRNYMPHTFDRAGLGGLLPVRFVPGVPEKMPESLFKIALTPTGMNHIVTRQDTDPDTNSKIWQSLPTIYWRRAIIGAKPGASVLLYAKAADAPEMEEGLDRQQRSDRLAEIVKYQRSRALVSVHKLAMGRVMFLSFDRTWRMRYRVGDTYHHKFWGQVLRWADSDRLRSGTDLVKLGTDRSRYSPQTPVRVRANIVDKKLKPVEGADISIELFKDDKVVLRRKMLAEKGSPGRYAADLGKLPGGAYRAVLGGDEVARILAEEGQADSVETEFSVDTLVPAEQVELAADRGLATRLAKRSGGRVLEANEARQVLRLLASETQEEELPAQWPLWDSWWLLIALLALASAEWLTRKRAGLA